MPRYSMPTYTYIYVESHYYHHVSTATVAPNPFHFILPLLLGLGASEALSRDSTIISRIRPKLPRRGFLRARS